MISFTIRQFLEWLRVEKNIKVSKHTIYKSIKDGDLDIKEPKTSPIRILMNYKTDDWKPRKRKNIINNLRLTTKKTCLHKQVNTDYYIKGSML